LVFKALVSSVSASCFFTCSPVPLFTCSIFCEAKNTPRGDELNSINSNSKTTCDSAPDNRWPESGTDSAKTPKISPELEKIIKVWPSLPEQTFELKRLPLKIRRQAKVLAGGGFADRRENILAFGKPGSGKTHLLCGICHELARQGKKVYFATCDLMVQELLRAKQELVLDKLLKKLGRFDVLMIDDFGYVKQNREEMEVLFTLLAHRYERGSVLLTSNLPFSKWEMIFKDPMTTAAAIDRLVHHSVILELNVPSYRAEQARKRKDRDK